MGRGRAKAKQTKVARELKYSSPQTDFERLQREALKRGAGNGDNFDRHGGRPGNTVAAPGFHAPPDAHLTRMVNDRFPPLSIYGFEMVDARFPPTFP